MAERVARARGRPDGGQASLELLAGIPALVLAALLALQLLAAGYSLTLADGAVEAGALALVADRPAEPAVRAALPGWARDRVEVEVEGGRVAVRLRPPSPLPAVGNALAIRSTAWARPPAHASAAPSSPPVVPHPPHGPSQTGGASAPMAGDGGA